MTQQQHKRVPFTINLGSKGPRFDPRVVPKSECMFADIYHY